MLLRDPYALNAICASIVKCLLQLSEHSKLPRVSLLGAAPKSLQLGNIVWKGHGLDLSLRQFTVNITYHSSITLC